MASARRGRRGAEAVDELVVLNGDGPQNALCPLTTKPLSALEHPVRDKLNYVYERAAVKQYIEGKCAATGASLGRKQTAHPAADGDLTLRELRCARALVAKAPAAAGQAEGVIVLGGESEDEEEEEPVPKRRTVPPPAAARATPPLQAASASPAGLHLGERCLRYSRSGGCDVEGRLVRILPGGDHGLFLDSESDDVMRMRLSCLFTLRGRKPLSSLKLPEAGQQYAMLAVPSMVKRYQAQSVGAFETAVVVDTAYSHVVLYVRTGLGAGKVYQEKSPGWCLLPA